MAGGGDGGDNVLGASVRMAFVAETVPKCSDYRTCSMSKLFTTRSISVSILSASDSSINQ